MQDPHVECEEYESGAVGWATWAIRSLTVAARTEVSLACFPRQNCSGRAGRVLRHSRPDIPIPRGSAMVRRPAGTTESHPPLALPIGRIAAASLLTSACLFLGGCNSFALRGDSFPRDETFQWSGRVRPPDSEIDCSGFSNKARQIEQDLGAR
jgi:hypothetical protein